MPNDTPSGASLLFNRQPAPGIIDRVNTVIDLWDDPCRGPWWIYAQTAWPAALEAFGLLLGTNATQVARGYFRPRGVVRRRHGGFVPRRLRGLPPFADVGNEIGKRLPGAQQLRGRKVSNGVQTLWRIDGGMQRALNAWLLVEAGSLFAYRWTTGIYETRFCQEQLRARGKRGLTNLGAIAPAGWYGFTSAVEYLENGMSGAEPGNSFNYSGGRMKCVFAWPVRNFQDTTTTVEAAWAISSSANIYPGSYTSITLGPHETGSLLSVADVPPGWTAQPIRRTSANIEGNGDVDMIARGENVQVG